MQEISHWLICLFAFRVEINLNLSPYPIAQEEIRSRSWLRLPALGLGEKNLDIWRGPSGLWSTAKGLFGGVSRPFSPLKAGDGSVFPESGWGISAQAGGEGMIWPPDTAVPAEGLSLPRPPCPLARNSSESSLPQTDLPFHCGGAPSPPYPAPSPHPCPQAHSPGWPPRVLT